MSEFAATGPLVSVIVPAYNHARFVAAALQSVVGQSYQDLELIVIDDASRDDTPRICERMLRQPGMAARFRRIEIMANPVNLGAPATLNRGLRWVRGHYVTFLNSDDSFAPERIATLVGTCRARDARFAFSAVRPIDDDDRPLRRHGLVQDIIDRPLLAELSYPSLSFGFMGFQLAVSTGNLFLARDLVQAIGDFVDLKYCHDWDYALRAILLTEPVFVNTPLYNYRIHDGNSFARLTRLAENETRQVLTAYFARCERAECSNPLAPNATNWPDLFQAFARHFGVHTHYASAVGEQGRWARTVDHV